MTSENFNAHLGTLECQRAEECDKGAFESSYSDQAECQDDYLNNTENIATCYIDHCDDFDAQQANQCLKALRTDTCESYQQGDWFSDCDSVYTGCDSVDLALCIAGVAD